MGAFGNMSMGNKFGIVLGCLVGATFILGFAKLAWDKRKLRKNAKKAGLEVSLRSDKEKLFGRGTGVGDLFGVRAVEHGYFGGVSQSRPTSPTPSYILAPETKVVDWSKAGSPRGHSPSSSTLSLPQSLAPSSLNHTKRKPSPLSLQPSSADPSTIGGMGCSYLPPLLSPRSQKSFKSIMPTTETRDDEEAMNWVSPLDVYFSRPSTPKERPTSYLPKLQFPGEIGKIGLFVPSPSNSVRHAKSQAAAIVSSSTSLTIPPAVRQPSRGPKTPIRSVFFPTAHPRSSRAPRGGSRSIFPTKGDDNRHSSSRRSPGGGKFSPQTVPLNDIAPPIVAAEQGCFPRDTRNWSPSSPVPKSPPPTTRWDPSAPTSLGPIYCNDDWKPLEPVIRDSLVSIQRIYNFQPTHTPATAHKTRSRGHSVAASSIYSTRTSVLESNKETPPPQHSRTRSSSISALPKSGARSRSTSTSRSQQRSTSSQSITRTRDSLRRHSRMPSFESLKNRRSRNRDQMHYNPTSINCTRAGSVQCRKVDFDRLHESPFSNANAIRHSSSASIYSTSSHSSSFFDATADAPLMPQLPSKPPQLEHPLDLKSGRDRSESETSEGSVGDFYDAYYRQSILGQRVRAASLAPARNVNVGVSRFLGVSGMQGANGPILRDAAANRPAPARVGEMTVEIVTANERFPSMI